MPLLPVGQEVFCSDNWLTGRWQTRCVQTHKVINRHILCPITFLLQVPEKPFFPFYCPFYLLHLFCHILTVQWWECELIADVTVSTTDWRGHSDEHSKHTTNALFQRREIHWVVSGVRWCSVTIVAQHASSFIELMQTSPRGLDISPLPEIGS